jgi:hypothetical protein
MNDKPDKTIKRAARRISKDRLKELEAENARLREAFKDCDPVRVLDLEAQLGKALAQSQTSKADVEGMPEEFWKGLGAGLVCSIVIWGAIIVLFGWCRF